MTDCQDCNSPPKNCTDSVLRYRKERTIELGDTTYDLFVAHCSPCARSIYRLMRSCGASLSVYQISKDDCDNLDEYVEHLHESFIVDVEARLSLLRHTIDEFNSRGLFEAEEIDVHHVRLIDKARLIMSRFAKNGILERILQRADDEDDEVVAAFVLGCLATDNFWVDTYEEAIFEGYAHIEGREAGRPLARAARLRQGRRSRRGVIDAASKLYNNNPLLRRNDCRTATLIAEMKLTALRKRDGTYLGPEAIVKHLRAARQILGNLQ